MLAAEGQQWFQHLQRGHPVGDHGASDAGIRTIRGKETHSQTYNGQFQSHYHVQFDHWLVQLGK